MCNNRHLERATFVFVRLVFLVVLVSLFSVPTHAQSQSGLAGKRVLILHSHEANAPVFLGTDKGLSDTLRFGGISNLNQFFDSLDLRRNPGSEYRKLLVKQMRMRYSHRKPDMIITMYPEALEFVLNDCKDILPDVPILALYLPRNFEVPELNRSVIAHFPALDIIGTLEIALKLVPGAKRVYVVSGTHDVDRRVEDQARRDLKKWEGRLEFHYLSHMPFKDMLATVSKAPPDSIILVLVISHDVRGKNYIIPDVAQQLSQVSTAPIFGIFDSALGHGITGGSLLSFQLIGNKAGQLVLDILGGVKFSDNIPAVLNVPSVPMFDWRQLRRWNLDEDALPKGSIVINKGVTLWDFRYHIIGVLALCLAETALIVILIVQRRRKKVAELSQKQAEENYRDIFDNALEGIYKTSPEGQSLAVNPALARMLGYDSPEEVTSTIKDSGHQVWVDPNDRLRYVRLLEEQGIARGYECQYKRKDGTKFWVSLNTRRVTGPNGQTLFYTGFIEDITERKRTEEAIRISETKYRQLYEGMMDGYCQVSTDGVFTGYNEAYLKLTGYGPEELLRLTYRDLTPEKWSQIEEKIIKEQVLVQGYSQIYEKEYRKKDGTITPVELRTVLVKDETGANRGMWAIVRDITERKRAEQEAFDARRELLRMERRLRMGELSASLSHELNQPLTAILSQRQSSASFSQSGQDVIPANWRKYCRTSSTMIRGQGISSRSLRAMVRPDEGERELISINDVLHETVALFNGEAIIRNLRVEMDLADALPLLHVNKVQIQQVLINLMMNAAESMTEDESAEKGDCHTNGGVRRYGTSGRA